MLTRVSKKNAIPTFGSSSNQFLCDQNPQYQCRGIEPEKKLLWGVTQYGARAPEVALSFRHRP